MIRHKWIAVLLGLVFFAATVDFACAFGLARGHTGLVGVPIPPPVGIVPGTLAPGTCNPCIDSVPDSENYFYGNPWPPQHQPAQQGSPTSPYYNSDVIAQWVGAQLQTIASTQNVCLIGSSPSGAASGSSTDYGIDHVNFYSDGSDTTGPSAPVTVSSASGDPQTYSVVSVTGNGTTAVATIAVPFAFHAPMNVTRPNTTVTWSGTTETVVFSDNEHWLPGTLVSVIGATPSNLNITNAAIVTGAAGTFTIVNPALTGSGSASVMGNMNVTSGHGDHITISGNASFNGSYQIIDAQPADYTHTNATITFASAVSAGPVSGGTLNDTEPVYWCVPVSPANFNDGLHEMRATVYPKVGWPRLMQGPHFISKTGSNTGIDETNGTGIFTVPAHGFSNDRVSIDSVTTPGANPCLATTGVWNSAASNYGFATMLLPLMPTSAQPPLPMRGYQFAFKNTIAAEPGQPLGVVTMQNPPGTACTDDGVTINVFRGNSNFNAQQFWMPYGGAANTVLLTGFRNNLAFWFFTKHSGFVYNPTITVDSNVGVDSQGCGTSGSPCASIDGAINFSLMDPDDVSNTLGSNNCTLNVTLASAVVSTPSSGAGACALPVGGELWNGQNAGAAASLKKGMHTSNPFYIAGIAGEATGTILTPGTSFVLSSIPVASPTSSSTYACPSATTFMCPANFTGTGTILTTHLGGDGMTLILNGTPSVPGYYNFGTQAAGSNSGNFSQWLTIQGQTPTGAIINSSGNLTKLTDAANVIHTITAATWTVGQVVVTFASSVAPTVGSAVNLAGLSCSGCGTPNGTGLIVTASSLTSATVTNAGVTSASGTFVINNVNAGPSYSYEHLKDLSICGVDPTINVSPLCSPTEPNPYTNITLGTAATGVVPKTGIWLENVAQYGIGTWMIAGCGPGTPCPSSSANFSGGVWFTGNDRSWNMGTGPIANAATGFSDAENMLYSHNLGQYQTTGMIRNVTDDGLAEISLQTINCTAGNPTGFCNGSNLISAQNVFPVTAINPQIATSSNNFSTAPVSGGGTYATRFGWPNPGAWFVNTSASIGISIAGSVGVQACYDATGAAPNCPSGQAAFATCETAGISCLQLGAGGLLTSTVVGGAAALDTNIHVDAFFQKDSSSGQGLGNTTNVVTLNFNIPDRDCTQATTDVTCNISEGIISQAPTVADWALINSTVVQVGGASADVAIHVSGSFENWYVKNNNWGSSSSEITGLLASVGTSGPLMPPGGGEFGNGKLDGVVWDNNVCGPQQSFAGGQPLYYSYWAKDISGDGAHVTMDLGDAGITIPSGTPITTRSFAGNDFHTQAFLNSIVNPTYPISSATLSGGVVTANWLPYGPQIAPNVTTAPVTLPIGTPITVAGLTSAYTPTGASWSGTTETITFTPADTIQVGASVTPSGLACTACGGTPNPNLAGAVTASSAGSITYTNATLTGSGSMTLASPTLTQTTLGYDGNFTTTAGASGTLGYPLVGAPTVSAGGVGTVTINSYEWNPNSSITWSGTTETVTTLPGITIPVGNSVIIMDAFPLNLNFTTAKAVVTSAAGSFTVTNTALSGSGTANAGGVTDWNQGTNWVNGGNTFSAVTSAGSAGQIKFPSKMNLPIMYMLQYGSVAQFTPPQVAGFVVVPGAIGGGEDAVSYMNAPAVNPCTQ